MANTAVAAVFPRTEWVFKAKGLESLRRHFWRVIPGKAAGKYSYQCAKCGGTCSRRSDRKREICKG